MPPAPRPTPTAAAPILPVRAVLPALAAYRALGFEGHAYEGGPPDDPVYGFLRWGPVQVDLTRVPGWRPKASTSAVYLYVDDARALHDAWAAADVPGRLRPPAATDYGLVEFAYHDPDGNLWRVGSEAEG